jgi:hypothetical protein
VDETYGSTGARWRTLANFTSRPLYSREITPVPIEYEAGWALRVGLHVLEQRKSLAPTGIRFFSSPKKEKKAQTDCGTSQILLLLLLLVVVVVVVIIIAKQ